MDQDQDQDLEAQLQQDHNDLKDAHAALGRQVADQGLLIVRLERQAKEASSSLTGLADRLEASNALKEAVAKQYETLRVAHDRLIQVNDSNGRAALESQAKLVALGEKLRGVLMEFHGA